MPTYNDTQPHKSSSSSSDYVIFAFLALLPLLGGLIGYTIAPDKTRISVAPPTPQLETGATTSRAATSKLIEPPALTPQSHSKYIKVLSPNGGEQFKIGSPMSISWVATDIPEGVSLTLELFQIDGATTSVGSEGQCNNCVAGGGLRGGVNGISVTEGIGTAVWTAGQLHRGGYVVPGSNYIFKATASKTGYETMGECPLGAFNDMCTSVYEIDWSDGAFTLSQ